MLAYKAGTDKIMAEWKSERNSTRQCPNPTCQHHNKIKGRVYKCRKCGLRAHRDAVGSWNILCFSLETDGLKAPTFNADYVAISNQKYLAPVSMKGMSGKFLSRSNRDQQVASSAGQPRSVSRDRSMTPEGSDPSVIPNSCRETVRDGDMDQTTSAWDVRKTVIL